MQDLQTQQRHKFYSGEIHWGLAFVIGNGVQCSIQQQLVDKRRVVPASGVMQGRVSTVVSQTHISSMLQCTCVQEEMFIILA